jgi:L-seryl-tRNA(Ser) seleniumtransferase
MCVELRELPSVDELLRDTSIARLPRSVALNAVRETLARARGSIRAGTDPGDLIAQTVSAATNLFVPRLRRTINATGVVLHTNLGRAPLARAALARVEEIGRGYSNLEYDLVHGRRGSRHVHVAGALRSLTGAEDALVVNNNAAALLLVLAALADDREVVVSRGELIEIGDGFRIPDILASSGARLREVGTTNQTNVRDYEQAIDTDTALLLRVHQSNFRTVGFTGRPSLEELVAVAHTRALPLLDDLGSSTFVALHDEPLARDSIIAGVDLVSFSGDKLLGGPQAGIVVGDAKLIERMRRHPLQRALRPDKLTLAALEGTLLLYLDPERAVREIPVLAMLGEPLDVIRARADRLAALCGGAVVETTARAGGGALPLFELPSVACAVEPELGTLLCAAEPPVLCVVRDGRALLDCRTLNESEIDEVAAAIHSCRRD